MAIRTLRKFEDPILRKKCKEVEHINNRIRLIMDDMIDTLHSTTNGGALAANQIGVLRRLVVIDLGEGIIKLVNPRVVHATGEQFSVEGCLSFPDIWGKLKRPEFVIVEALDENENKITVEESGLMARCLCHEIDHLDGCVFIDKIEEYIEL